MSIILEGPDNAGKTSLAEDLQRLNPNLHYFHSGSAPRDDEHEVHCLQEQWHMASKPNCIVDRITAISQQVYKDGRLFEEKLMMELQKYVLSDPIIIVYCRPSTDTLMQFDKFTWREGESEAYRQHVIANQHKYIERYDLLMQRTPHILYDFKDEIAAGFLRKWLATNSQDNIYWLKQNVVTKGAYEL